MSVIGSMAAQAAQGDRIKELRAENERLRAALRFARWRIEKDATTMIRLYDILAVSGGAVLAEARKVQEVADTEAIAIVDAALNPSN